MSSPFASGVTSADIQALQKRFDDLEKLITDKFNSLTTSTSTVPTAPTTTLAAVSGLSEILPKPSQQVDLSDIFPKEGGRRKKTRRGKKRNN